MATIRNGKEEIEVKIFGRLFWNYSLSFQTSEIEKNTTETELNTEYCQQRLTWKRTLQEEK